MVPVGMAYFALYYFAFRFVIARFDLKTPGREAERREITDGCTGQDPAVRMRSCARWAAPPTSAPSMPA